MFGKKLRFERATGETIRARVAAAAIVATVSVFLVSAFGVGRPSPGVHRDVARVLDVVPLLGVCVWLARTRDLSTARFVRQARVIGVTMLVVGALLAEFMGSRDLFWIGPGFGETAYNVFLGWNLFVGGSAVLVITAARVTRVPSWIASFAALASLGICAGVLSQHLINSDSSWIRDLAVSVSGVGVLCVAAWLLPYPFQGAATRGAALEQDRLAEWLHSELLGDLAALRRKFSVEAPGQAVVLSALADLDSRVREHRLESRLHSGGSVPLAEVVAYQMRRFRDYVTYSSTPMLGTTQVEARTAQGVHRVLGDLLANAVAAGAGAIGIEIELNKRDLALAVIDDGPGIAADRLRSGGGLQLLEQSLAADGGTLAIETGSNGHGTRVSVRIPTNGRRGQP